MPTVQADVQGDRTPNHLEGKLMTRHAARAGIALLIVGSLLGLTGCRSTGAGTSPNFVCAFEPDLPGAWESSRTSQLGQAKMKIEIDCNCFYRTTVSVFGNMEIEEEGPIRFDRGPTDGHGSLTFFRENGSETTWQYRLKADALELEEAPGEWHSYERSTTRTCSG